MADNNQNVTASTSGQGGNQSAQPSQSGQPAWKIALGIPEGHQQGGDGTQRGQQQPPQGDQSPPQSDQPPADQPPTAPPPSSGEVKVNDDLLRQLIERVSQQQQVIQQPTQPEPQLTKEEIDKLLNVYNATPETLATLGIEPNEQRVGALNNVLQAIARQAASISHWQLQAAIRQIGDQLAPLQNFVTQQNVEAMKSRFYKEHPDLQQFEPLLIPIKDSIVQSNRKFNSEKELFKTVADMAYGLLKELKVPMNQAGQQPSAQQGGGTGSRSHSMPTLSGGGQGGAGDGKPQGGQGEKTWIKVAKAWT